MSILHLGYDIKKMLISGLNCKLDKNFESYYHYHLNDMMGAIKIRFA